MAFWKVETISIEDWLYYQELTFAQLGRIWNVDEQMRKGSTLKAGIGSSVSLSPPAPGGYTCRVLLILGALLVFAILHLNS